MFATFALGCQSELIEGAKIDLAGSGTDAFRGLLPNLVRLRNQHDPSTDFGLSHLAYASAGHLIGNEFDNGGNLYAMWGGAFEVAALHQKRFQKVDKTLHLNWWLEPIGCNQAALFLGHKAMIYRYIDQHLTIHTIEIENGTAKGGTYVVSPLLHTGPRPNLPPDFTYEHLSCHVRMLSRAGKTIRATNVIHGKTSQLIEIVTSGDLWEIKPTFELFDGIRSRLQTACDYEIVL